MARQAARVERGDDWREREVKSAKAAEATFGRICPRRGHRPNSLRTPRRHCGRGAVVVAALSPPEQETEGTKWL